MGIIHWIAVVVLVLWSNDPLLSGFDSEDSFTLVRYNLYVCNHSNLMTGHLLTFQLVLVPTNERLGARWHVFFLMVTGQAMVTHPSTNPAQLVLISQ